VRRFVISVASLALAAAGCQDREAARLTKIKDEVCACKTTSCAETALKQVPQGKIEASHRAREIARDMLDCLAKVYEADRPTTDPDAPTSPGSAAPASAGMP
jgi:hypothetical protein